jgi:prephenate dehydrogenase
VTDLVASGEPARRANVIGLGLIGGSVALALRGQGWRVTGDDTEAETAATALERGVVDAIGLDADAEITFVAVPVLATADQVKRALAETSGAVTDVGSVKAPRVLRHRTRGSSAATRWPAQNSTASMAHRATCSRVRSGC